MKSDPAPAPDSGFITDSVVAGGVTYQIRELSSKGYDKCVELATVDGEFDTVRLMKWIVVKSVVEPALDIEKLGELPFSAVRALSKKMNAIYFPDEDSVEGND